MIRPRSQRHLLVRGATVLTQDAERRVLGADVLITEGRIAAVARDLTPPSPARLLDARGLAVIPGLIQPRALLGRVLLRGVPLAEDAAWDRAHDDETGYWAGLLGSMECLTFGVTTIAGFEMSSGMGGMRRALEASGIRAVHDRNVPAGRDVFSRAEAEPAQWLDEVTRGNAGLLNLDAELGSLEPGKAGDLVVVDIEDPRSFSHPDAPWPERILSSLNRGLIRWVVVDGEVLVDRGRLPHLDVDGAAQPSAEAARKLSRRLTGKGH